MTLLLQTGPRLQREIANATGMTRNTVGVTLSLLKQRGHVTRDNVRPASWRITESAARSRPPGDSDAKK